MPAKKKTSVTDLKKQLHALQSQIEDMEDGEGSGLPSPDQFEELFVWEGPERIFVPRNKRWFSNVALFVIILLVVTLFFKEFLLMGVILAILFVLYILATVPPLQVEHKITSQGITTHRHSYLWEELADFWFSHKYEYTLVNIDTYLRFPGRLTLVIDDKDKDELKELLAKYLPYREVTQEPWTDRLAEWFSNKLSSL